jgi:hypothetical protein
MVGVAGSGRTLHVTPAFCEIVTCSLVDVAMQVRVTHDTVCRPLALLGRVTAPQDSPALTLRYAAPWIPSFDPTAKHRVGALQERPWRKSFSAGNGVARQVLPPSVVRRPTSILPVPLVPILTPSATQVVAVAHAAASRSKRGSAWITHEAPPLFVTATTLRSFGPSGP